MKNVGTQSSRGWCLMTCFRCFNYILMFAMKPYVHKHTHGHIHSQTYLKIIVLFIWKCDFRFRLGSFLVLCLLRIQWFATRTTANGHTFCDTAACWGHSMALWGLLSAIWNRQSQVELRSQHILCFAIFLSYLLSLYRNGSPKFTRFWKYQSK